MGSSDELDDLDGLLALARDVQMSVDSLRRRKELVRLVFLLAALVLASSVYLVLSAADAGAWKSIAALAGGLLPALASEYQTARITRELTYESRALGEINEVLRRTVEETALREEWSPLRRARVMIELSRLDNERA